MQQHSRPQPVSRRTHARRALATALAGGVLALTGVAYGAAGSTTGAVAVERPAVADAVIDIKEVNSTAGFVPGPAAS